MMFDAVTENVEPDRITKFLVTRDGSRLPYSTVLELWESDASFRDFCTSLLRASPFAAYRWETPAISRTTINRDFEFVLLNAPGFSTRRTDSKSYEEYFTSDNAKQGIVAFKNLSGDATLVVPSPRTAHDAYGHLATFVRNAPESQIHELWRTIAATAKLLIGDAPRWLSTAGGGVAWLHVRFDSTPKYYGYLPYRNAA